MKKCTTPVSAIAKSTGKKRINTGERIVPSPKPEKNVSIEAKKAVRAINNISIHAAKPVLFQPAFYVHSICGLE